MQLNINLDKGSFAIDAGECVHSAQTLQEKCNPDRQYRTIRESENRELILLSILQIMRKFGRLGLLTGTQIFQPSKFHDMVGIVNQLTFPH